MTRTTDQARAYWDGMARRGEQERAGVTNHEVLPGLLPIAYVEARA